MSVTFEEARERVWEHLRPSWELGELYVAPWGHEDADAYQIIAGARQWITGDDPAFMDLTGIVWLVDKATGAVDEVNSAEIMPRLLAMSDVGATPPEAE